MFFSKFLVILGAAAAASAAILPSSSKQPVEAVHEKRAITGPFKLQVQGGAFDGLYVVGAYDTTGAFISNITEAVPFSLGVSGLLRSPVGRPGILGLPTIAWIFFDDGYSEPITGCSIDPVTDILTGCTGTYGSYTYSVFGAVSGPEVWALGNAGTNWAAEDGYAFTALKAIAI
ncbi:hypothetical protein TWF730_007370 [Orbilia blumenaviensis]|uniref:Uncharacterized protein n=1 Tax=Orbilia blumenaviensis TaxID=1796055 RepID=A0AAV9VA59_9PEZI